MWAACVEGMSRGRGLAFEAARCSGGFVDQGLLFMLVYLLVVCLL